MSSGDNIKKHPTGCFFILLVDPPDLFVHQYAKNINDPYKCSAGDDGENAEHDACKIEHIISEESYEKLKKFTAEYNN